MNLAHHVIPADPVARRWGLAATLVLAIHGILVLGTFRHYGMSWDQPTSHSYGEAVVRFYASWGNDHAAQTHWLRPYGGLFELCARAVETITGLDWIHARNLCSGLFGWLGVFAILRAGWLVFGPQVGVTAGAFLALTPLYYGHQFINPKDLPFAAVSMLALSYMAELLLQFPVLRWRTVLCTAAAIGAALGIRVGGLQLFGVLGLGLFATFLFARPTVAFGRWRRLGVQGAVVFLIAWTVMILTWPFALSHPFTAPFDALKEFSKFWWDGFVFYDGKLLKTTQLPATYIPNLLLRTMPEHILLGLLAAVAVSVAWIHPRIWQTDRRVASATMMFTASILLPISLILGMEARVYDGLRHVLFIVPPLVLLAASGLWAALARLPAAGKTMLLGLTAVSLATTVADMRALHPYQYIYFNRLVGGGLATANRSYDLDYWATALREGAEWVAANYNPPPGETVVYSAGAEPEQVELFLHPPAGSGASFRRAAPGEKARLFLVIRRGRQTKELTWGRPLWTVARQGVPLLDIVEAP